MPVTTNVFQNLPGVPATPNFFELVIHGQVTESVGVQQLINILHFARVFSVGANDTPNGLATTLMGPLNGALSAALSSTYTAIELSGRYMDDVTNMAIAAPNLLVGAIGGDRLPSFNAVVTRKTTYARGRSYRGSNHWAPIAESDTTLDQLNAGAKARWDTVAASLATLVGVADTPGNLWTLCVLSTTLSTLKTNPTSFTGSLIQAATANAVIGTMKRRKQGVGT